MASHTHDRRCSRHLKTCECTPEERLPRLLCNPYFEGDYCPDGVTEGYAEVLPEEADTENV
jgi:hypothetical protein